MNIIPHLAEYGPSTSLLKNGPNIFYLSTSKGYILKYSCTKENCPILLKIHKITSKSITCMEIIKNDVLLISNSKGFIYLLKDDNITKIEISFELKKEKIKSSEDDEDLSPPNTIGITNTITSNGPSSIFLGNDDGDIFECCLENSIIRVLKFYSHHSDLITGLVILPNKKVLLASSGDGILSVIDLKKGKVMAESKNFEEEISHLSQLNSLYCISTGGGSIKFFKWNYWGAPCDSLKEGEHDNAAINTFDTIPSKNILISGCEEGIIRLIRVLPEKAGSCASLKLLSVENESIEKLICLENGTIIFITCDECAIRSHLIEDDKISSLMEINVQKKNSKRKNKKYYSSSSDGDDDDDDFSEEEKEEISKSSDFFGDLD